MITRKISAALAAGCSVVIKPSEETPYSAVALCQLANEAGFPPGVINLLTTSKHNTPVIGKILCEHEIVKKISFTGSTRVGKLLMNLCSSSVKKTTLELGGNAPFIVFKSADISKAVNGLLFTKFRNTGQACISANRILVDESIYDQFISTLADEITKRIKVGNGFEDGVTNGPLINDTAVEKMTSLVDDCVNKGGKVLVGGRKMDTIKDGSFFEPTIIGNINLEMKISKEEIFGPIVSVIK
jgi:acyl-CoA reductase-like NAD-dependent aldehyde dehydrogenase